MTHWCLSLSWKRTLHYQQVIPHFHTQQFLKSNVLMSLKGERHRPAAGHPRWGHWRSASGHPARPPVRLQTPGGLQGGGPVGRLQRGTEDPSWRGPRLRHHREMVRWRCECHSADLNTHTKEGGCLNGQNLSIKFNWHGCDLFLWSKNHVLVTNEACLGSSISEEVIHWTNLS